MGVVDRVAKGAFGRVNTSIAITMASRVSVFLSRFMTRSNLILSSTVVLSLLVCARRSGMVKGVYKNPLTTAKSVMGIVATTAIMKQVDDMGNSLSPGGPLARSQDLLPGQGISVSRIPSVVLGTCFVLASGAIPGGLKNTEEGSAIYMGIQYAYSDIILSSVTGQDIRRALSMVFVLMLPTLHGSLAPILEGVGPLSTLLSSATFAGVSFVMDVTMPLSTGSLGEDLVRGVASVLLIHAVVSPIPSIAGDIESYATWLIARRFSNLMGAYGVLEVTACICVGLAIIQSVSKWWGGVVLDVMSNLFVLVASFLLAEWLMSGTNTGSQGDSIILLASMLSMGRLLMVIVV